MKPTAQQIALMTDDQLYDLYIYHRTDDNYCRTQRESLLGLLIDDQDNTIMRNIDGNRVLDVGAGNGDLSRKLKEHAYYVTAIEPHEHTRELAKKWNGVDELPFGIYSTPFPDRSFDTVILRESVEHIIFEDAIKEIERLCEKRVMIFEPNLNFIVRTARGIVGQKEFNPHGLEYFRAILYDTGFPHQQVIYQDTFTIPLSGGFSYRQLVPRYRPLEQAALDADKIVTRMLNSVDLAPWVCWRYLLLADRDW